MRPQVWIPISIVLLLAVIIAGSTRLVPPREAPEVTQMRQLTKRMFDQHIEPQERFELGERMRQLKKNIPKPRREEVYRAMSDDFQRQVNEHTRKFASLPEDERIAFLDRDIDIKQMSAKPDGGRSDRGRQKKKFKSMPEEQRKALKRAKLDYTSAEDRAYRKEYKEALKQRMEQRGLNSWSRGGK